MKRFVIIGVIIVICVLIVISSFNNNDYIDFFDTECDLTIKIISGGEVKDDGTFYICRAININNDAVDYKTNIRIKIFNDEKGYAYGDVLYIRAKLFKPDEARNPGNFDYRKYLLSINVSAVVTVKNQSQITYLENDPDNILVQAGIYLNNKICTELRTILPDKDSKIIEAILLGNKEYITQDIKDDFANAGISHYMSVSGAHAIFFLMPFSYLLKLFKAKKQYRYIIEIILTILYISIAGFGIPVIRASVIIIMNKIAFLLKRDNDKIISIFIAMLILTIQAPFIIYSIGAWLSFICAFSIEFIYPRVNKFLKNIKVLNALPLKLINAISLCISVQIGILPIMINNFSEPTLFVVISNLITTPIIEFIMVIGIIMIIFGFIGISFIAELISYVVYILGEFIIFIARFISGLSTVKIFNVSYMTTVSIIVYYVILYSLLFLKPRNKVIKNILVILFISSILLNNLHFTGNVLKIVCIDVGQGDSIFIKSPSGKTYLIDCGSGNINNISENRVIPFLKSERINKLNFIALSHTDYDHISGIYCLLNEFDVEYIIMPDILFIDDIYTELVDTAKENNTEIIYLKRGDIINDGEIILKCLHPYPEYYSTNSNSLSMVLELEYRNFKGLFTGDLEAAEERLLYDGLNNYNLLKAAHHGSNNSSTSLFLEKIKPEIVLISCSKSNNFGHPGKETLERLSEHTKDIYITSNCGAITVKTNGDNIEVFEFIKE